MKRFSLSLLLAIYIAIVACPIEIQRLLFKFLLYFVVSYSMFVFYNGTKILNLGQTSFFAMGAYGIIISDGSLFNWFLSFLAFAMFSVVSFYVIKDMDPMSFSISTICLSSIMQEVTRILKDITGGTDGIYKAYPGGLQIGIFLIILLSGFVFVHYIMICRSGFQYKSQLIWSGRIFAESFGLSVEHLRCSLYLQVSSILYLAGIAYGLLESYITISSTFNPFLTLVPLSVTLVARHMYMVLPLVVILLGLQELLSYAAIGYQGTLTGIFLIIFAYFSLVRKED